MRTIDPFTPSFENCGIVSAVTLGTYDGVHIGHAGILRRVVRRAKETGTRSVVVTFDRHPSALLNRASFPGLLTSTGEKLDFFESAGIDITCILTFTEQVARMTAEEFIHTYLLGCLGMKWLVVGYDHGFGRNRGASTNDLRLHAADEGFFLDVVPPITRGGVPVKSSVIRSQIREGDMENAATLLGRDYSLSGTVIHGSGLGKSLGFPTANLRADDPEKLIPKAGVYAGRVSFDDIETRCLISSGPRPTFGIEEEAIEVHIPDYTGDLYGKHLRIGFSKRLRDIVKFPSKEDLIQQVRLDIAALNHLIVS
jgi:riboflavin kinase / FMN adenylyltransferase